MVPYPAGIICCCSPGSESPTPNHSVSGSHPAIVTLTAIPRKSFTAEFAVLVCLILRVIHPFPSFLRESLRPSAAAGRAALQSTSLARNANGSTLIKLKYKSANRFVHGLRSRPDDGSRSDASEQACAEARQRRLTCAEAGQAQVRGGVSVTRAGRSVDF